MYKVMVDCDFGKLGGSGKFPDTHGFVSIKFENGDEIHAKSTAIERTKVLMREKGYLQDEIDLFTFSIEEIDLIEDGEVNANVEKSFVYY